MVGDRLDEDAAKLVTVVALFGVVLIGVWLYLNRNSFKAPNFWAWLLALLADLANLFKFTIGPDGQGGSIYGVGNDPSGSQIQTGTVFTAPVTLQDYTDAQNSRGSQ
jgi:hypothetical protein